MERRDALRAIASAAALTVLPHKTLEAWSRVASGIPSPNELSPPHLALVKAIADTIIPRTDTPCATDVGVHKFVDVIVNEQLTDAERTAGLAGLDAIDALARSTSNVSFANMSATARGAMIDGLESGDRSVEPSRTYWRLKGLVIHGYFTSEPVMRDVLKVVVMPGKFEGAAPIAIKRRPSGTATPRSEEPAPTGHGEHTHA
ncbi:MAG: gluconate 2-dehydrogenase subunit 3 family protein [Gemmatimonadaceae bacterium]